jgi:hypothetical protein
VDQQIELIAAFLAALLRLPCGVRGGQYHGAGDSNTDKTGF